MPGWAAAGDGCLHPAFMAAWRRHGRWGRRCGGAGRRGLKVLFAVGAGLWDSVSRLVLHRLAREPEQRPTVAMTIVETRPQAGQAGVGKAGDCKGNRLLWR